MGSLIPRQAVFRQLTYELIHAWQAVTGRTTFNFGFSPVDEAISSDPELAREAEHVQLYSELLTLLPWDADSWGRSAVLEIATGSAGGLLYLQRRYGPSEAVGIDVSTIAAWRARRRGLDVRRGNANRLPFENERFHGAICVDAVNYFDESLFMQEVRRVLKPGGSFVLTLSGGRWPTLCERLDRLAHIGHFEVDGIRDLTDGVRQSVQGRAAKGEAAIARLSGLLQARLREMMMLPGSEGYRQLLVGENCFGSAMLRACPA
jgi:SAM-dependent methyltransferase